MKKGYFYLDKELVKEADDDEEERSSLLPKRLSSSNLNQTHRSIDPQSPKSPRTPHFQKKLNTVHHSRYSQNLHNQQTSASPLSFFLFAILTLAFGILCLTVYLMAYTERQHVSLRPDRLHMTSSQLPSLQNDHHLNHNLTVVLFGDSLLNIPYTHYDLPHKIKSLLPTCFQNITILNKGKNGNKVRDLRQRLTKDVLLLKPDVVFLHFDSDISDQEVDYLSLNSTQLQYKMDYDYILHMMTSYKIPHIAIAGPGLLGEGLIVNKPRFRGKEGLLDRYRFINLQLANSYDLPYLDIRKAYQEALPSYWIFSFGYVTTDGEHPNDRGSDIIAEYFSALLNQWYIC